MADTHCAKRIKISLEPIEAPKIDFIRPDGSMVELPLTFTDPAALFARQVAEKIKFDNPSAF